MGKGANASGDQTYKGGLSGFCSSDRSAGVASVQAFTGRCHGGISLNNPARLSWMKDTPAGEPCFGEHGTPFSIVNTFFFIVNITTRRRGLPSRSYN